MISFCQNLSLQPECQIYDNKSVRKIIHKRTMSNNSDQTFEKPQKLFNFTRYPTRDQKRKHPQCIAIIQNNQKFPQHQLIQETRRRSFSNHIQDKILKAGFQLAYSQKEEDHHKINKYNEIQLMQLSQKQRKQRIFFNRQEFTVPQKKQIQHKVISNHTNQTLSVKSITPIKFGTFLKFNPSQQKRYINQNQNQIDFKASLDSFQKDIHKLNKKQRNEPQNQRYINRGSPYIKSENLAYRKVNFFFKQNLICPSNSNQQNNPKQQKFMTPTETTSKGTLEKEQLFLNPQQLDYFPQICISTWLDTEETKEKIQTFRNSLEIRNPINDDCILYDAKSIISRDFNQFDDENKSIVEQRNFFFEKEEEPQKVFKKSFDKLLFFEPGYISEKSRWILFNNVHEKESMKIYSVKEFSRENQRHYFDEYDVYLSLRASTSQMMQKGENHGVILNLFNTLSNPEEKKFHLIKQPFDCILNEHILDLKKMKLTQTYKQGKLWFQKVRIELQIERIFQFFSTKAIMVRRGQNLQIEDFVVCKTTEKSFLKFHNLHKLQKGINQLDHKGMPIQELQKQKLGELYKKINELFFHQ